MPKTTEMEKQAALWQTAGNDDAVATATHPDMNSGKAGLMATERSEKDQRRTSKQWSWKEESK